MNTAQIKSLMRLNKNILIAKAKEISIATDKKTKLSLATEISKEYEKAWKKAWKTIIGGLHC